MLLCIVCGKTIANVDPNTVRYGVCAECPLDVARPLLEEKSKPNHENIRPQTTRDN